MSSGFLPVHMVPWETPPISATSANATSSDRAFPCPADGNLKALRRQVSVTRQVQIIRPLRSCPLVLMIAILL